MGKYFGTDGFRGKANENLTAKHAFEIGRDEHIIFVSYISAPYRKSDVIANIYCNFNTLVLNNAFFITPGVMAVFISHPEKMAFVIYAPCTVGLYEICPVEKISPILGIRYRAQQCNIVFLGK